jgi:hypothetical protein
MKEEALRLALEALSTSMYPQPRQLNAIAAIKQALEQPQAEPEPVAKVVSTAPERIWLDLGFDPSDEDEISFNDLVDATWSHDNATGYGIEYVRADTSPPKREWQGLTADELNMIGDSMRTWNSHSLTDVYVAIEAKLKEKNT